MSCRSFVCMNMLPKDLQLFDIDQVAVAEMILLMRRKGIRNTRVLSALEAVPRRLFLPSDNHQAAYRDRPQPIECGQVISAPSVVGLMTEALDVSEGSTVLQIGTGTGYQAAILALMGAKVFTVERYSGLTTLAQQRFSVLRLKGIQLKCADGNFGWPIPRQFNRILISASVTAVPPAVEQQLAPGGILVAPFGRPDKPQTIRRLENMGSGWTDCQVGVGRFTAMHQSKARVL